MAHLGSQNLPFCCNCLPPWISLLIWGPCWALARALAGHLQRPWPGYFHVDFLELCSNCSGREIIKGKLFLNSFSDGLGGFWAPYSWGSPGRLEVPSKKALASSKCLKDIVVLALLALGGSSEVVILVHLRRSGSQNGR